MENTFNNILESLIEKRSELVDIPNLTPTQIYAKLRDNGFVVIDFQSNGWDHDFWVTFKRKDIQILYSGNWFVGSNYLSYSELRISNDE